MNVEWNWDVCFFFIATSSQKSNDEIITLWYQFYILDENKDRLPGTVEECAHTSRMFFNDDEYLEMKWKIVSQVICQDTQPRELQHSNDWNSEHSAKASGW